MVALPERKGAAPTLADSRRVDLARRRACKAVDKLVISQGDRVIRHPEISFHQEAMYRHDGVHLSEGGMDLWLHDIHQALRD